MPIAEPILYKALTTRDLVGARDALLLKRFTGLAAVQYADGSRQEYKSDAQMAAALAAIERELARRRGATRPSTVRVASSKGLDTP